MKEKERSAEDRKEQGECKLSARDHPLTCSLARHSCKHWLYVFCGQRNREKGLGKESTDKSKTGHGKDQTLPSILHILFICVNFSVETYWMFK